MPVGGPDLHYPNEGYVRRPKVDGTSYPYFSPMQALQTIPNQGVISVNAANITSHENFGSANCARYTSHSLSSPPFSYSLGTYVYTYRKYLPEMVHDPTGKSIKQFVPCFDNLYGFPMEEAHENAFIPFGIAMTEYIAGHPSKVLTTVATRGLFTLPRYTGLTTEPAWSVIAVRAPSMDPEERAFECPAADSTGGKIFPVMYAINPGEREQSETTEIHECMEAVIAQIVPKANSAVMQDDSYDMLRDTAFQGIFPESTDGTDGMQEYLIKIANGEYVDPELIQRGYMASMLTLFNITCHNKQDFYGMALIGAAYLIITTNRSRQDASAVKITMQTMTTFARYCSLCCMRQSHKQNEMIVGRIIGVAVPDTCVDIFIGQM